MKKLYSNLKKLIKNNLNTPETEEALNLIFQLKNTNKKEVFNKKDFYNIAMWKTPRPKKYYLSNSEEKIIIIAKKISSSNSDKEKIELLISLKGVSIAVASSILTIINPKDYGILILEFGNFYIYTTKLKQNPQAKDLI
jgi:hypothetical protein